MDHLALTKPAPPPPKPMAASEGPEESPSPEPVMATIPDTNPMGPIQKLFNDGHVGTKVVHKAEKGKGKGLYQAIN